MGSPCRRFRQVPPAFALLASVAAAMIVAASLQARPAATLVDIEIAIDTTGSMGLSIAQAQRDAKTLVADVRARYPGAMFAVVQFRDKGDSPEYQVMQAMTGSGTLVDAAIDRLTPGGGGDDPEALNLVFRGSADSALGWRSGSRKLVVVISDAEPHGAGSAGYTGCRDASTDPFALSTASALAEMRKGKRTLILVRQAARATATLECYQSLAAAGYTGGAARNGGTKLIAVIEALIRGAVKDTGTIRSISFSFRTYANNVRVGPPLVGRFQLGTSQIRGSGRLDVTGKVIAGGVIRDEHRPNAATYPRPKSRYAIWARVVGGTRLYIGSYTRLELSIVVTATGHPESCVVGTRGTLVLTDDERKLPNGHTADTVGIAFPRAGGPTTAPDGGASCRTHNEGYTNQNDPNTDPPFGGPPDGGQWARVTLGVLRT